MIDPVADALNRLVVAVQSGLQMTARDAVTNDIYRTFQDSTTITGNVRLTVWDPGPAKRYVLRGGIVAAIVSTTLVAASAGQLFLNDNNVPMVACPLGAFAATAPAGTIITGPAPFPLDMKGSYMGAAVGAVLNIKSSVNLGAGVISVCGVLWGTEVTY